MSDQNSKKFSVYDLVIVGVMAAIIFVLTYFIKIKIPTPAGETMLKVANAFCLLAGILFGGLRGGLAAGIGSMFYDLLDPTYITSAPTTFLKFFLMALFCGLVAKAMRKKEIGPIWTALASSGVGAISYVLMYGAESFIKQLINGADSTAAIIAITPKLVTSGTNAIIAIVVATILAPALYPALKKAGVYNKIKI